jgi:methionyl-tRNA formyltransferase
MRILYVSSLGAGKECLRLIKDRISVDHIVTIDPDTAARAKVGGYADFTDLGIAVRHAREYSMKGEPDQQMVKDLAPDLMIVNGWNRLIPRSILDLPRLGCIGFHGSWKPLPFGRGRSPITWAILNGATQFFLHLFHLDEGVDSGDVIDTARFDITPHDTCGTLHEKVGMVSASLLLANVPRILDGTAPRTPQVGVPTYLPKRTPEQGRIAWTMRVDEVCTLVRAVTRPYSGAFTDIDYRGERIRMVVWDAVPFSYDIRMEGPVGSVVHELDGHPLIRCRDGLLLVKDFTRLPG